MTTRISNNSNEEWVKNLLNDSVNKLKNFAEKTKKTSKIKALNQWVENNLPKFIYFDNYDVIDSAVHISTFLQQANQNKTAPRIRTTKCLFEHAGLEIEDIQRLDPTNKSTPVEELRRLADERSIKMSSASSEMTTKFSDWWEQRRHRFRYQVDGPFFRVWVADDLDPSEIELDQRSM